MRVPLFVGPIWMLAACGGRSESGTPADGGAGDEGMGADAGMPLVEGPIDASGLPTAVVMKCSRSAAPIAFRLPCFVTPGPEDDTECYALDDVSLGPHPVLLFWVPLRYLASRGNEPIDIDAIPQPPAYYDTPLVAGGVTYKPTRMGMLTASQVDLVAAAYVGRLRGVEFTGMADEAGPIVCSSSDAPFWAVAFR